MITKPILLKYLWLPDRIKLSKPDPEGNDKIYDHDKIVKKQLANIRNLPSQYSLQIQQIVDHYHLKQPITAYRLCLFYGLTKTDYFEDPEVVPTTVSVSFLKRMLHAWRKFFPLLPKPIIARLFIPKGMPGFSPSHITKRNKSEGEFILGTNRSFYASADLYKDKLDGEMYQWVDFDVSFAVLEETYQKFKNMKHVTHEMLLKYDKELKQKKFN